jgi:hypothetical protein
MDLLFGEFIGDIVMSKKDRAIDEKRESLWTFVKFLLIAFESSNSTNFPLFQNCKELTESGYNKLFSCYNKGKERLMQIYRQEVLKINPINTKGRRAKEVITTKIKDIKNAKHVSKKYSPQSETAGPFTTNTTTTNTTTNTIKVTTNIATTTTTKATTTIKATTTKATTTTKTKRSQHISTEEEKSILTPYLVNPNPSDEETKEVFNSLIKISPNYWTKKKIKDAWRYVHRKKQS